VRGKICADYYALGDYFRQKDYLLQRLIVRPVKTRQIVSKEPSGTETLPQTRKTSAVYYLEYQPGIHMCKSFFLKTLCLSNRAVMTAIDRKSLWHLQQNGWARQAAVSEKVMSIGRH